jgi:hypothetical protein
VSRVFLRKGPGSAILYTTRCDGQFFRDCILILLRSLGTGCLEKVAQSPCEGRQLARVVTICGKPHLRVFASQAMLLVAGLSVAEYHMYPHLEIRYADKGIPCYTPGPFVTQANPSTRALRLELPECRRRSL